MSLDNRKIQILMAIIDDYIKTAEPVGSRTIVKKYDMGISSATIRNEMADLEELGFLLQPYTSSGRIPSDKGYKLYVDELMKRKKLSKSKVENIRKHLHMNNNNLEELLKETAKIAAIHSNYTVVITKPSNKKFVINRMQLIGLSDNDILLVTVINNDIIKNHVFTTNKRITQDMLDELTKILNNNFVGLTMNDITNSLIGKVKVELMEYYKILDHVLGVIANIIRTFDKPGFYIAGLMNILNFPEFNDLNRARNILRFLEDSNMIRKIVKINENQENKIMIKIGRESGITEEEQCSIVSTQYKYNNMIGVIAIIGPTRMDYVKAVSVIDCISKELNHINK